MKTKHLFLATALVASFAACTNEDVVEVQQGISAEARATVENVRFKLVGEGLDSRLAYDSDGYAWEATDSIGALNMDVPVSFDEKAAWLNKYKLVNYVNTSYPFTYDESTQTWVCPGKMLEGNYFFAFPFSNYGGSRLVNYSFFNQKQDGLKGAVVAKNFAKNQIFIGYAQIKSGDKIDMVNDLQMTSILGALQLRIKNVGENDLHITKIVLKHDDIENELTFDPTNAKYTAGGKTYSFNRTDFNGDENWFNYANYVEDKEAIVKYSDGTSNFVVPLYQIDETITDKNKMYNHETAIRSVVNYDGDIPFVQLTINGTKAERTIAAGSTGYALIMVNPLVGKSDIDVDIYTEDGVLEYKDIEELAEETTLTIAPGVANTIVMEADAKDLKSKKGDWDVYSEEDLMQYISWNTDAKKATSLVATMHDDITLTKEMVELLQSNDKLTLTIKKSASEELTIAEDVTENVLDYDGLVISTGVIVNVEGNIEITDETQAITTLNVLEGATLKVVANKAVVPTTINNEGTLTIAKGIKVATGTIVNKVNATMIVEESADVAATVTNQAATEEEDEDAVLDVYGYVSNVTNNGVVNMKGASAKFAGISKNNGIIYTIAKSEVAGTNNATGEIVYVKDAVITATNSGYVSYVINAATTVTKDSYKDQKINKLNVYNATLTVNDAVTRFTAIALYDKATLTVNKDKSLTADLIVKGAKEDESSNIAYVTGEGSITGKVTVEKNAKLVNSGTIYASAAAGDFVNKGVVENTGSVQVLYDSDVTTLSTASWYYVAPTSKSNAASVKNAALKKVIVEVANNDGYALVTLDYINATLTTVRGNLASYATNTVWADTYAYCSAYTSGDVTETEFTTALGGVKTDNASALKTALLAEAVTMTPASLHTAGNIAKLYVEYGTSGTTGYKSAQTVAYDEFRKNVLTASTGIAATVKNAVLLAGAALSDDDVTAILTAKAPNAFIWKGCNLDKAIDVWKKYDAANLKAGYNYSNVFDSTTGNVKTGLSKSAGENFIAWAAEALKVNDTALATELSNAGVTLASLGTFKAYTDDQYSSANKGN